MLTIKEVKKWVSELESIKDDCEMAHHEQDDIFDAVLQDIANGNPKAQRLAQEALKTYDVNFDVYYS